MLGRQTGHVQSVQIPFSYKCFISVTEENVEAEKLRAMCASSVEDCIVHHTQNYNQPWTLVTHLWHNLVLTVPKELSYPVVVKYQLFRRYQEGSILMVDPVYWHTCALMYVKF